MAPPDMTAALQQGSVDAICFVEPWTTRVELGVEGSVRVNTGYPDVYSPGIMVTTQEILDREPELIKAFLTAAARGQQWARQNEEELLQVNRRWVPGVTEDIAKVALPRISFDMRLSDLAIDGIANKTIPGLLDLGLIKSTDGMADTIAPGLLNEVIQGHPEYFDDLPPIQ
jgi:hypothetical protein